jgi:aldose 1-epimerase
MRAAVLLGEAPWTSSVPIAMHQAPPSGEQWEIASGALRATIVEVGGGVRSFHDGARAVLEPYDVGEICDGAHGAVLIPWPNRLADGRYEFDGAWNQLPISEPATATAIHGLLRWVPWRKLEHDADRVLVGARMHPRPGYPFDLETSVEYRLDDAALEVTTTACNRGRSACPFAAGQHPYLSPGEGLIDACTLELPAASVILLDERKLPCGRQDVAAAGLDFRQPRSLAGLSLDAPFSALGRDSDGLARARLHGADGCSVELWADESYRVLEVFTGDTLAPGRQRTGLAVEPMSCPPNGLRSGEELLRIEPGRSVVLRWGVRLLR